MSLAKLSLALAGAGLLFLDYGVKVGAWTRSGRCLTEVCR
jgi:hypothetical protein